MKTPIKSQLVMNINKKSGFFIVVVVAIATILNI